MRGAGAMDAPTTDGPANLIGLSRDELAGVMADMGEKPFRARQLWHWLYRRGESDFARMTTLAKPFRKELARRHTAARPRVMREQTSKDSSRKWLFGFADGNEAECVFIPEEDRGALCISTQVGCTLTCPFCHTGTQDLVRNLEAVEIVGQVMAARDALAEWGTPAGGRLLSNIVIMGMGEPLLNYEQVARALSIIMDGEGIAISRRRITLSTSGIVPMIPRVGRELGVNLAVSLHAPADELRDRLVPINRKYPIARLMEACRDYPGANNARRITFEYILLGGVNDSPEQARELARLVRGIPAKFNLIPFNPWPGAPYRCSSPRAMKLFARILNDAGYSAPIRVPRGRDIMAACGQLKSDSLRRRAPAPPPEAV